MGEDDLEREFLATIEEVREIQMPTLSVSVEFVELLHYCDGDENRAVALVRRLKRELD